MPRPATTGRAINRVDGDFAGTTDQIIQWAACKWGIDEEHRVRAPHHQGVVLVPVGHRRQRRIVRSRPGAQHGPPVSVPVTRSTPGRRPCTTSPTGTPVASQLRGPSTAGLTRSSTTAPTGCGNSPEVLAFGAGSKRLWDAWAGSSVGDVDVVEPGGVDPGGSSDPADPSGRRGPRRARRRVRRDVLVEGSSQRSARGVVESDGAHGAVLDPFGAGLLRATQLRPALQVVPRSAHRRRRSTRRRSPRTASGSWIMRSPTGSSRKWSARRSCVATSRASTSPSTARCWRRGRRTRASSPKDGPPSDPPAGRNIEVDWRGQKRSNDTHTSTTDPEARLARKSMNTAAGCATPGIC